MSNEINVASTAMVLANAIDLTLRIVEKINSTTTADSDRSLNTEVFVTQRLINNLSQRVEKP